MDDAKAKAFWEKRRADPVLAETEWRRTRVASFAFLAVLVVLAVLLVVFGFTGDLPGAGIALGMTSIGMSTGWMVGVHERAALVRYVVEQD